jgi:pimeloyl-ACP methyl ester carboxylesterase
LTNTVETFFLTLAGRQIEVQQVAGRQPAKPPIVLLHEGLGSNSLWKDFPFQLAERTGRSIFAYSRYGYGNSDVLERARPVRYLHDEALKVLPEFITRLSIRNPVLVGHSDGASIALIYAGAHDQLTGLVLLAPHVFVEDISLTGIRAAKQAFETTDLAARLAKHHRDARATFWGWNDIWLHPDFRSWNIEEYLPRIMCPVLAIQGFDDEYATMAHLDSIARHVAGPVEVLKLENCRHSPHRDCPEKVLVAIEKFVDRWSAPTA